jgi:hypothetical protein
MTYEAQMATVFDMAVGKLVASAIQNIALAQETLDAALGMMTRASPRC